MGIVIVIFISLVGVSFREVVSSMFLLIIVVIAIFAFCSTLGSCGRSTVRSVVLCQSQLVITRSGRPDVA